MSHNADDPVADFLAREQDDMAGLEGDDSLFTGGDSAVVPTLEYDQVPSTTEVQLTNGHASNEEVNTVPNGASTGDVSVMRANDKSPVTRAEPETIRRWREEQEKRLKLKDEDEAKAMEAWRKTATKELEDWQKQHDDMLAKTNSANRKQEKEFISERDAPMDGKPWEKITKLCEFNSKNAKNTKDVTRMRQLLIQMKQSEQ